MNNKQNIESGDNSVNVQGKNITYNQNNYGISYSDVKDIAMTVFKSNFYDLGQRVESIVQERAEKILDDYLLKLNEKDPKYVLNTQNPDIRYTLYEAQKNYARRGDKNTGDLLVETLVQRTITENNPIKELVLNEALEIIPKITTKQIDILSLIFLIKYLNFRVDVPVEDFLNIIRPIKNTTTIDTNDLFYQHLQYTSCLSVSIGSIDFKRIIQNKFPQIKDEKQAQDTINSHSELSDLKNMWDNSQLSHCSLTSVGIAIAISNIKVKSGLELNLDIWINE